jgi:hypothetical protein
VVVPAVQNPEAGLQAEPEVAVAQVGFSLAAFYPDVTTFVIMIHTSERRRQGNELQKKLVVWPTT